MKQFRFHLNRRVIAHERRVITIEAKNQASANKKIREYFETHPLETTPGIGDQEGIPQIEVDTLPSVLPTPYNPSATLRITNLEGEVFNNAPKDHTPPAIIVDPISDGNTDMIWNLPIDGRHGAWIRIGDKVLHILPEPTAILFELSNPGEEDDPIDDFLFTI